MAWPTNKPDSNKFSADTDSIKESRPELNTMSQAVNDIVDFVDTTNIAQNYILMYNASNGRLEPAEFSATTTISQDSAGGPFVINASGGLNALVDDTSPELGADLEVGDFLIKSTDIDSAGESAVRIRINTQASYRGIFAETDSHAGPPSPSSNTFTVSNNGDIGYTNRTASIELLFNGTAQDDITGAGFSIIDNGSHAQANGGAAGTGIGHKISAPRRDNLEIIAESDKDLELLCAVGTGKIKMYDEYTFPKTDGTTGQVLQTNGSGTLSFATISGGITDINAAVNLVATTPDSGGSVQIEMNTTWDTGINCNDQNFTKANLKAYKEAVHQLPYNANLTPSVTDDGNLQEITLTGNINFQGFANAKDGQSLTLIIHQDGTGNRTFTEDLDSATRMLFAGGTSTLSTAGGATDIMTISLVGGIYYASLSTNFS